MIKKPLNVLISHNDERKAIIQIRRKIKIIPIKGGLKL